MNKDDFFGINKASYKSTTYDAAKVLTFEDFNKAMKEILDASLRPAPRPIWLISPQEYRYWKKQGLIK